MIGCAVVVLLLACGGEGSYESDGTSSTPSLALEAPAERAVAVNMAQPINATAEPTHVPATAPSPGPRALSAPQPDPDPLPTPQPNADPLLTPQPTPAPAPPADGGGLPTISPSAVPAPIDPALNLAATAPPAAGASPTTGPSSTAAHACSRFQPGHYVHIVDDTRPGADGLAALRTFLSKDVTNFKGVQYSMNWGMLETSPGVYDFSRLDAALAQVKAKSKYLLLFFKDRTFHTGCDSEFVPSYVSKDGSYQSPNACFARIWEQPTMDHMIRVLKEIAVRYKDDTHFLGISLPETAVGALSMKGQPKVRLALYEQLKRAYPAVHAVAPHLIIHQMMNWPFPEMSSLYDLTDQLVALGGGGAIGWPDTVLSKADHWGWYKLGREYSQKAAIIPHVQTPQISASREETDRIYGFLVDDINAHMIVWGTWHKDIGNAYLTEVVMPTVNKHNGAVKNTACPW